MHPEIVKYAEVFDNVHHTIIFIIASCGIKLLRGGFRLPMNTGILASNGARVQHPLDLRKDLQTMLDYACTSRPTSVVICSDLLHNSMSRPPTCQEDTRFKKMTPVELVATLQEMSICLKSQGIQFIVQTG